MASSTSGAASNTTSAVSSARSGLASPEITVRRLGGSGLVGGDLSAAQLGVEVGVVTALGLGRGRGSARARLAVFWCHQRESDQMLAGEER